MFRQIDEELRDVVERKFLNRRTSLELIISEKCQNACKYCYRRFKHDKSSIFTVEPSVVEKHIENFLKLFNYSNPEEFFGSRHVELYGGDPLLSYKQSMDVFEVVDKFKPKFISIPTNARLVSELSEYDIEKLLNHVETPVHLSLSVDGMPSEGNRPLSKIGKMLDYENIINYNHLYKMALKYNFGFHPMLYFDTVEKWFDTVKYFYENFKIVPYLLEIRHSLNKEVAIEAVIQLLKIREYYQKINERAVEMSNTIRASIVPRGLGCSALTTITIMPNGDMPFCHRVIDSPWVYGNVNYGVDVSKMISMTSVYDHRNVPECFACPIRDMCSGQCGGACYEYWGSPWIPIPSVCDYIKLKAYVFSLKYDDWYRCVEKNKDELKSDVIKVYGEEAIQYIMKECE
jgi:radical SAM protein with 4Fe4S-binding SPASM domain